MTDTSNPDTDKPPAAPTPAPAPAVPTAQAAPQAALEPPTAPAPAPAPEPPQPVAAAPAAKPAPAPPAPKPAAAPPAPKKLALDLSGAPTEVVVGTDYVGVVKATGGKEPYKYRLLGNPPHAIHAESGEITFVPTRAETSVIAIEASDSADPAAVVVEGLTIVAKVPEPAAA